MLFRMQERRCASRYIHALFQLARYMVIPIFLAICEIWATPLFAAQAKIIIGDDRGGAVDARARIIRGYRKQGAHLEIRGNYCLSSCTMYLSLRDVCVLPDTLFGFHGPSSAIFSIGLSPAAFEYWSRIMAAHYPEPVRTWFLQEGRNRTMGFHIYHGWQLINMGIRRCPET